jgi:diketogulonate reductase-like aldo/keto reductase
MLYRYLCILILLGLSFLCLSPSPRAILFVVVVIKHQMAYNPWAPDWAVETFEYCQKNGIAVTAYSSLGGLFSKSTAETAETIRSIAKAHSGDNNKNKRSAAQVMLRWALQKNAAVIPGTGNPQHMRENLDAYNFELSVDEMKRIDALRQDASARKFFFMKMPAD